MAQSYLQSRYRYRDQQSAAGVTIPGDPSSGRLDRTLADASLDRISVRSYGIYDDGGNYEAEIQALIDEHEGTGKILHFPIRDGGFYGVDLPVQLKTGVYLALEGASCTLRNTRAAQVVTSRELHVFQAGTYHPVQYALLTYHTGSAIATPTNTFPCATVAQAGNYTAGDMVVIRSAEHYLTAAQNDEQPIYALIATVLSANAGTGAIVIDGLIDRPLANPRIAKVNGTGLSPGNVGGGTQLYMPKDCGIIGGGTLESVAGAVCGLGGHYNATFDVANWIGDEGIFINSSQRSSWRIRNMRVRVQAFDLAMQTALTSVVVDNVDYIGVADPGSLPLASFSENLRNCNIHVKRLNSGLRTTGDVMKMIFATNNTIRFDSIYAPASTASLITLSCTPTTVSGMQVQPTLADNNLEYGAVEAGGGNSQYLQMVNTGAGMLRNRIRGNFRGAVSTWASLTAGTDTDLHGCTFAAGAVNLRSGTTTARGVVRAPGGLVDDSGSTGHTIRVSNTQYRISLSLADFHPVAAMKDDLADAATGTAGTTGGHTPGNFGRQDAAGSVIIGLQTNANAITNSGGIYYFLPHWYQPGGALTLILKCRVSVARFLAQTIDATVQASSRTSTLGSDICATAAQTITASYAFYSFTITPTGLLPGDRLFIAAFAYCDDTGGASAGTFNMDWAELSVERAD